MSKEPYYLSHPFNFRKITINPEPLDSPNQTLSISQGKYSSEEIDLVYFSLEQEKELLKFLLFRHLQLQENSLCPHAPLEPHYTGPRVSPLP